MAGIWILPCMLSCPYDLVYVQWHNARKYCNCLPILAMCDVCHLLETGSNCLQICPWSYKSQLLAILPEAEVGVGRSMTDFWCSPSGLYAVISHICVSARGVQCPDVHLSGCTERSRVTESLTPLSQNIHTQNGGEWTKQPNSVIWKMATLPFQ